MKAFMTTAEFDMEIGLPFLQELRETALKLKVGQSMSVTITTLGPKPPLVFTAPNTEAELDEWRKQIGEDYAADTKRLRDYQFRFAREPAQFPL